MSLYAEYLKERTNDLIIENEFGFATYRYLENKTVYIIDIYVEPKHRQKHVASFLTDEIVNEAKEKGCTTLLGTICIMAKGCDVSLRILQAYGFKLKSAHNEVIIMKKDI